MSDPQVAITGTGSHTDLKQYHGTRNFEDVPEYYTKTFEPLEFNLAEQFSRKLMDDNKLWEMQNRAKSLLKSYKRTCENFAALIFDNIDQTSFTKDSETYTWTLCCDGGAIASTSHSTFTGDCTTLDNKDTSTSLDGDQLETMMTDMQAFQDDSGNKGNYFGDTLLVPFNHRKTALELIGSDGKPSVTNNNYNIYEGHVRLIVWRRLAKQSGKTYYPYYLIDSDACKDVGLFWMDRVSPEITDERDFDTMSWKVGIYTRFVIGSYEWRPIIANVPA